MQQSLETSSKSDSDKSASWRQVIIRLGGALAIVCVACLILAGSTSFRCGADGIPEPSLVMYGTVSGSSGERLTNGTLAVTFVRSDGTALNLSASLSDINGQFSYALYIPCETELPGFPVTRTDLLRLASTNITYSRSNAMFNGSSLYFSQTNQVSMMVTSAARGRFERVDFSITPASAYDPDGSGLLISWELQYFGHLGVDPNADADGTGVSNLDKMKAGLNPLDPNSRFQIITVTPPQPGGTQVGTQVVWTSEPQRVYAVFRSNNLQSGFVQVGKNQNATPPNNTYLDAGATGDGPYFYVIRLVSP